jgi:hypothetical protein
MSGRAAPIALAFAALLGVNAAVLLLLAPGRLLQWLLLGGAAVGAAAIAAALARRGDAEPVERRLADVSLGTLLAAYGFGTAVAGTGIGSWLILIGGGVFAAGVGASVRERRSGRVER